MRVPRRAQHRAHPGAARRRAACTPRSSRSAGSPSAIRSWCGASSPAATSSPATATATGAPPSRRRDEFRDDIRSRKAMLEDIGGSAVLRLPRAELLDRHAQPVGVRRASRDAGYRYSSSIYPIAPRPLRHARRAALRATERRRRPARSARSPRCACCGAQLAGRRRRLFPPAARTRCRAGRSAQVNRDRPAAGDVLFPSVGARPRPAARRTASASRRAFAITSTSTAWSRACSACCATSAGTAWTASSWSHA